MEAYLRQPDENLRRELLAMLEEDLSVREELAAEGSLFDGYHPRMQAVHRRNAARLAEIIEQYGWPGRGLVGDDAARAAWMIVQHAISEPDLQRRVLVLIKEAAASGEAPLWQAAMLEDRIRGLEGKLQAYGTQFDWDEQGEMSPYPAIENPEQVDERRREVGLGPLEEDTRRRRAAVAQSNEKPPADIGAWRKQADEWARSVGWRKQED